MIFLCRGSRWRDAAGERRRNAARSTRGLGRDLLVRKLGNPGALGRVLDRDCADVSIRVDLKECVLVEVAGLSHRRVPKLDVKGVSLGVVADLHGTNPRSKKALWTVSPSGKRITRRKRPSASGIRTHRRIRPSAWTCSRTGERIARSIHS